MDVFNPLLSEVQAVACLAVQHLKAGEQLNKSGNSDQSSCQEDVCPIMVCCATIALRTSVPTDDIRGAAIYGRNDEKLGKIDDVIFDHSTGSIKYVVVDTGGWFSTKKFLVPPHRLQSSAEHEGDFTVNVDKQQIEAFPPYNESELHSEEKWKDYEKKFDRAWESGPVQHRQGSDRDITPTPDEMPAQPGSIGSQLTPSERAEMNSRIIPAGANEVNIESERGRNRLAMVEIRRPSAPATARKRSPGMRLPARLSPAQDKFEQAQLRSARPASPCNSI